MKSPEDFDLAQAIRDLAIDRPVLRVDQLEPPEHGSVGVFRLYLYGGGYADWPPAPVIAGAAKQSAGAPNVVRAAKRSPKPRARKPGEALQ